MRSVSFSTVRPTRTRSSGGPHLCTLAASGYPGVYSPAVTKDERYTSIKMLAGSHARLSGVRDQLLIEKIQRGDAGASPRMTLNDAIVALMDHWEQSRGNRATRAASAK